MQAIYVIDLYGNNYKIVQPSDFIRLESNDLTKNDYFGYIDSNNRFISCSAHKNKYPQATFIVGSYDKIAKAVDPRKVK